MQWHALTMAYRMQSDVVGRRQPLPRPLALHSNCHAIAKLSASAVAILCSDFGVLLIVAAVPIIRLPLWLAHKLSSIQSAGSQSINPVPFLGGLIVENIIRQTCHDVFSPTVPSEVPSGLKHKSFPLLPCLTVS